MIKASEISFQKIRNALQLPKPWDLVIIFLLNILIAIPVFILAHHFLIDPQWPWQLDRILLFIGILVIIQLILHFIRKVIILGIGLYLIALIWGSLFGSYGFNSVFEDYRYMVYGMSDSPNPQDLILSKLLPFPNKSKIIKAVQYDNPKVRDFSLMCTRKYFSDVKGYGSYYTLIQCFAVFKEINSRWNYVSDPKGREYIATASESLPYLSGDCDDHAVLMAACVKSIGGIPRLIHTGGHIYPEILIGNKKDLETVNYLVKKVLFPIESKDKTLHYHIDERGQIWLNLDYTATYPGGPFMHEEILGALTLN
ncbi:transglutaminase [Flavobacterium silvaticum]|uniref:Transglutaminase n=1 Tax=Flavobacterium silvaticum TaxID=1852020 RepID=A0A972FVY2_9FLAO|nr:transglutaminase [Flavobacterium silvaticum]NMH29017.1 transglutaminase [Flavobacterium silvaticum]